MKNLVSPEIEHLPPARISNCSLQMTPILASHNRSRNPSHPWIFPSQPLTKTKQKMPHVVIPSPRCTLEYDKAPDEINPGRPLLPEHPGRLVDHEPRLRVLHPDGQQVLLPHLLHCLEIVVPILKEAFKEVLLVKCVQPGPHHMPSAGHPQKSENNSRSHLNIGGLLQVPHIG